ncbi:hypothetical protein [Caballeronia sp. S22]|uniref:hypothetical protein n=1 Tax=Caballeronia sp. S22 TaxID=3137182 RepID=UPI003530987B
MRVRENHRADRQILDLAIDQVESGFCGFRRRERIDHDPARLAANECHVGKIDIAHLIDAIDHLEQTANREQLRLPPEARIHRRGSRPALLQKIILREIDNRVAGAPLDDRIRKIGDEPVASIIEILRIRKRQIIRYCLIGLSSRIGGRIRRRVTDANAAGQSQNGTSNFLTR